MLDHQPSSCFTRDSSAATRSTCLSVSGGKVATTEPFRRSLVVLDDDRLRWQGLDDGERAEAAEPRPDLG